MGGDSRRVGEVAEKNEGNVEKFWELCWTKYDDIHEKPLSNSNSKNIYFIVYNVLYTSSKIQH